MRKWLESRAPAARGVTWSIFKSSERFEDGLSHVAVLPDLTPPGKDGAPLVWFEVPVLKRLPQRLAGHVAQRHYRLKG